MMNSRVEFVGAIADAPFHENRERRSKWGAGVLSLGLLFLLGSVPALAGGNWNDAGVQWQPFDKGITTAKEQKKPVCLVVYTEWCPHCSTYSSVFHDTKVVEQSKKFVMIRVDKDKNKEVSKQFSPDGEYIPRTYFLSSEGKLDASIHAPREQYKYFYDEKEPSSILAAMDEALKKLKGAATPPPAEKPATP